jgi:SnoaL-like domain
VNDSRAVAYYTGLLAGEIDELVGSFAGEPELHHPVRGRIRGVRALTSFVQQRNERLRARDASVEEVAVLLTDRRAVEEVVVRLAGEGDPVALPVAVVADLDAKRRVEELRIYFSTWPLRGSHAIRPPVLQPDPDVHASDVVAEYQHALAAGDVEAVLACFEEDAYAREPAGERYLHRGTAGLRRFYETLFSNGGGIPLEHCTVTDDGRACAIEYNVVSWGRTELPPEAGIAVYERGASGRLSAARIYDDSDPPLDCHL